MSLSSQIRTFIFKVPRGCIFDAHAVISYLQEKHPDDYLRFHLEDEPINSFHSRISREIEKFVEDKVIERVGIDSYSKNVTNKWSKNACWKKLNNIIMKQIIILLISIFSMELTSYAQEVDNLSKDGLLLVGRFRPWEHEDYLSVRVYKPADQMMTLWIGLNGDMSGNINLRYLVIKDDDWKSFEENMAIVDEKFEKWSQMAVILDEKNFKKTIPVDFEHITLASLWTGHAISTKLYAVFEVNSRGKCTLRLDEWENYTPGGSSIEEQMHTPYFIFDSPEAFNCLYELIKRENAIKNYNVMQKKVEAVKQQERDHNAQYN